MEEEKSRTRTTSRRNDSRKSLDSPIVPFQPSTSPALASSARSNRELDSGSFNPAKMKDGKNIKCVVIGDRKSGKTALCQTAVNKVMPPKHHKTDLDCLTLLMVVEEIPVTFQLNDCGGSKRPEAATMRLNCIYLETDVFIICFSVIDRASFEHVKTVWMEEVRQKIADEARVTIVLVGTHADLRASHTNGQLISPSNSAPAAISPATPVKSPEPIHSTSPSSPIPTHTSLALLSSMPSYSIAETRQEIATPAATPTTTGRAYRAQSIDVDSSGPGTPRRGRSRRASPKPGVVTVEEAEILCSDIMQELRNTVVSYVEVSNLEQAGVHTVFREAAFLLFGRDKQSKSSFKSFWSNLINS